MKITALLLFTGCLQVSATGFGQKVTLSEKNAPLEKVFTAIERQTGFSFLYEKNIMANARPVDIEVIDVSLEDALQTIFSHQPFTYKIFKGNIIAVKTKDGNKIELVSQLLPRQIEGQVMNKAGEPIAGANVTVKRTGKGTITDANGNFVLFNLNNDDIILVSYIGYKTQSIKVGDRAKFVLYLEIALNELDVVRVQAYGTTTDRLRTGNITTITAEEIERQPVMNILQALQGKVPGLEITSSSGFASAPYKVEIRGRKYLNNDLAPDPLIIVDGVPITVMNFTGSDQNGAAGFAQSGIQNPIGGQSPLFSIDPSEIESITVLKDADATALYGSRGGSGVIIITTKKGKTGETNFNASYTTGFQKNIRWYDLMNTQQYLAMRKEAIANDGYAPFLSDPAFDSFWPDIKIWDSTRYTNWQRYIYGGTGRISNADANVSGGNQYSKYRISMGYETRNNITTSSGSNDRISFTSNMSHNAINNVFKFDLTSVYTHTKVNTIELPSNAVLLPPNAPSILNDQNRLNFSGWEPVVSLLGPFEGIFRSYQSASSYLNNRLAITILPIKELQLKTAIGYSTFQVDENFTIPIISQNPLSNPKGQRSNGVTKGETWIIEPQAEYKYEKNKLTSDFLIGSTLQSYMQNVIALDGSGYTDDNLIGSVANAPIRNGTDAKGQYKYFSIFGRVNFNYNNKYVLNLNARRDGSSIFGPDKQYGNFWSIGGAWILSDEKWFHPLSNIISFFKLRSSYGTVGSDNINSYVYLTRWSGDRNVINPYGGLQSYGPTQHANPDLQWQENRKLEVASNINFLNDKISTEIVWYRDRCSNQLLIMPLPVMTGFPIVSANLPATVQNYGWEFRFTAELIKVKQFRLAANFNIGANKNKLLSFPNIENTVYANQYVEGKPLNIRYLFRYSGLNPATGEYTFEDKNNDGTILNNPSLRNPDTYGYEMGPKYFGGCGIDFSFKAISINSFFTFSKIPYVQRATSLLGSVPGTMGYSNQSTRALNRWIKPGDNAEFARYTMTPQNSDIMFYNSDAILSKGSYIRLQNLSLNYSITKELARKIKLKGVNIFARAENIILITKYDGLDPLSPSLGSYPQPFIMTLGVNLNL